MQRDRTSMIHTILTAIVIYFGVSALATVVVCTLLTVGKRHDVQAEATHAAMREQVGQVQVQVSA